jgi:ubiquinone/menaquinone biosynthesis C-methylase UbiE
MRNGSDYKDRLRREIQHYQEMFRGRMSQEVPPVWLKVEERFSDAIEEIIGVRNLYQYVARHVKGKERVSLLGAGSGACGSELDGIAPLLKEQNCQMDLTCIDVNETTLVQAEIEADKRGVKFCKIVQDINKIKLEANSYDVIVAYASLHHFIELDHIAREINLALRRDGIFVTVDIPTRNGYRMWDETFDIVNALWKVLPTKFKIAHTGYREPTYLPIYENIDYSVNSFECINSEAILPALRTYMQELHFIPSLSIARRFFDTKFGPNYDLNLKLDNSIFEFIMRLDDYYIKMGHLRPETFFGAYAKK